MLTESGHVLRHKLAVVMFWLAVLVLGGFVSSKLSSQLSGQFATCGASSY
jgi:uncharacterized membrane protein YdfJ with MMPL/SSD domain